jgi:invasion protein IalB
MALAQDCHAHSPRFAAVGHGPGQGAQVPVAKPPLAQDAGAAAATPSAAPPTGWEPRCVSAGRTAPATCTLNQRLLVQETGQPFLTLTLRVPAEPRRPFLALQTPLSLHLPSGLTLKIDEGKPLTLAIERCDQNACYAGGPLADDLLVALKAGQTLNVTMRTPDGQDLNFPVPLAGFTPGYATIQ